MNNPAELQSGGEEPDSVSDAGEARPPAGDIVVELYGIPRQRAGVERIELPCVRGSMTLGEILLALANAAPQLADACFPAGKLGPNCAANVDGRYFTRDPHVTILSGQTLLLMSADAGG